MLGGEPGNKAIKHQYHLVLHLKIHATLITLLKGLSLPIGVPQSFTLSVKPSRNYPLDIYFLMDLSVSLEDDLEIMQQLSSDISKKVVYVTHHWEIIMCMSVCVWGGGRGGGGEER